MKNWRNVFLLIAFMLFGVCYGGWWAYQTQYLVPRTKLLAEIEKAEQTQTQYETTLKSRKDMLERLQSQRLHERSLPTGSGAARTLYHSWLLEAGEACQFENLAVNSRGVQQTQARNYRVSFQLSARTSLDQLSRFLYEFYWVSFVHRITELNIVPVENADLVNVTMQIEGLIIPSLSGDANAPYPHRDQLPGGYWQRLSSNLLETYTDPIDSRNLLQFSRGGVDASDFAKLTGIVYLGGEPEFWIYNQLGNEVVRVKLNEQFRIGSFIGRIVEVIDDDVVLETDGTMSRPAMRWLLGKGELLKNAMAVPGEY